MIAFALAAMLQYGSCQSGGADGSRTAAQVANTFFEGMTTRKPGPIRWVTRPGTIWLSGDTVKTDDEIYAGLEVDVWPVPRLVVTGITGNGSTVAVTTVVRGDPESEILTVLSIDGGCVVEVRVYEPTEHRP